MAEPVPSGAFDLTWRPAKGFWLRPGGLLMARYTFNRRPEFAGEEANTSRFSVARARIILDGGLTDYLSFRVRVGVLAGGNAAFEQAYANIHLGPVTLRGGILYLPASIGDNPAPNQLQSVDYSQYGLQTSGGMAAGFGGIGDFGRVRVHAFLSNGVRTAFSEFAAPISARFAVTGRVEGRLFTRDGFDRFDSESSYRGSDLALRLGGAAHYQQGRATSSLPYGDLEQFTVDATLEGSGFNVILAARLLRIRPEHGNVTHDPGLLVQAGAFVHERIEVWARYDALFSDGDVHSAPTDHGSLTDDYQAFGLGINGYLWKRAEYAKVQADFIYVPQPIAATWAGASDNTGLLPTVRDRQWTLRTQLVLAY